MAKFFRSLSTIVIVLTALIWRPTLSTRMFQEGPQKNYLADITELRHSRLLQNISSYGDPNQDADVKKYCADQGINPTDLILKDQDRVNLYADVSGRYQGITDDLIDVLKTGGFNSGFSGRASNIVTKAPIIVISIILVCLIILMLLALCIWACVRACCCPHRTKKVVIEDVRGENEASAAGFIPPPGGMDSESSSDEEYYHDQDRHRLLHRRREEDEQEAADYSRQLEDLRRQNKETEAHELERQFTKRQEEKQIMRANEDAALDRRRHEIVTTREEKMGIDGQTRKRKKSREPETDEQKRQRKEEKRRRRDELAWNRQRRPEDSVRESHAKEADHEVHSIARKHRIFKICAAIVCVATVAVLIAWIVYLAKAVAELKGVRCGISYAKGLALQGYRDNSSVFLGVAGAHYFIDQIKAGIDSSTGIGVAPNANLMANHQYGAHASDLNSKFAAYPSKAENYAYLGLDGSTPIVAPNVLDYFSAVKPGPLTSEVNLLSRVLTGLQNYGDFFKVYNPVMKSMMKDSFDKVNVEVNEKIAKPVRNLFDLMMGRSPDYLRTFRNLGLVVLILGGLLILLVLLIIAILLAILFAIIKKLLDKRHHHHEHKEETRRDRHNRQIDASIVADENRILMHRVNEIDIKYDHEDNDVLRRRAQEDGYEVQRRREEDLCRAQNNPPDYSNPEEERQIADLRRQLDYEKEERRKREDQERVTKRNQEKENARRVEEEHLKKREEQAHEPEDTQIRKPWYIRMCTFNVLKMCQCAIIVLLIILSILVFVFAIVSVVGSAALTGVCRITYGTLKNSSFIEDLNEGSYFSAEAVEIAKTCIAKDGNGNLSLIYNTLNSDANFRSINSGFEGLALFKKSLEANFTSSQVAPMVGKYASDQSSKSKSFTIDNGGSEPNSVGTAIKTINSNQCARDVASFTDAGCPSNTQVKSQTTDTATQALGQVYCMRMEALSATKYSTRYAGTVTCAGTSDKAAAEAHLTKTYDTVSRYSAKANSFDTDYNTFYAAEVVAWNDFTPTARSEINSAYTSWKLSVDPYTEVGGTMDSALNCTALRRGVLAIENPLCYKVSGGLYVQTGLSFACAILLFLTAIAMFGSCFYTMKMHEAQTKRDSIASR